MKKTSIIGICIIAFVAIAAWAPNVLAYSTYGQCSGCHGGFLTADYTSNTLQDRVDWVAPIVTGEGGVNSLHEGHAAMVNNNCLACHQTIGDNPRIAGPSGDGFNSCMGCHGRNEDANNMGQGPGRGAGLRQHHWVNGITTTCSGCHPDSNPANFTPVGEDVPGARNAALGIDPCNDTVFGVFGSDNDGDNLYDGDDPDCAVAECGDGVVDPGEDCDEGDANGTTTCGCQTDCTYTLADTACENGEFCTVGDTCNGTGTCIGGGARDCDDGVGCTVDACDETSDTCTNPPDDASCDDGNVCSGIETCDPNNDCQAGTPLDCDDQELCTTDSCDSITGCANVPVECPVGEQCDSADGQCKSEPECTVDADCNDGFFCNGSETCDTATGTCQPGTPVDCDDGVDCTVDTCDEVNDECVNTPDNIACPDDGLFCTGDEICDSVAGCISTGDPCTEGMTCNEDTDTCDPSEESVQGLPWLMLLLE